ncbi:MAG: hypothetical protein HY897_20385 [Deltaproteobacteria bacterium]|nr:hypothetical protein [Deltaproteobacteria bacterium]
MKTKAALTAFFFSVTGACLFSCGDRDSEGTADGWPAGDARASDAGNVTGSSDGSSDEVTEHDAGRDSEDDTDASDGRFDAASDDAGDDTGCIPSCAGRCAGTDGCSGVCPDTCAPPQTCGGGGIPNLCGGADAVQGRIAAGWDHTCVLTDAGGIKCWGSNKYGQLGDGTTEDRPSPVDVAGLSRSPVFVAAGSDHTCVLDEAGGIRCWGLNSTGELGNGTKYNSALPVDVAGLSAGVTMVAVGSSRTCALTDSGGVKCWGWNAFGQLGDGTTEDSTTPVDVYGLSTGVVAISAGSGHTCALTSSGGVSCWGKNNSGQLGDGTTQDRIVPVEVFGLSSDVIAIAAGVNNTCAVVASGALKCWGRNELGQLGVGNANVDGRKPVDVSGLPNGATAATVGRNHVCALTSLQGLKCWGANDRGQLGDGTTEDKSAPADVLTMTKGVAAVAAGWGHTCASVVPGGIKCWGTNEQGQLGNGVVVDTPNPNPSDVVGFGR